MRLFRFMCCVLMIAITLSACATPVAPVKPPIRLAVNLWPGLYPAAIAQEQGFFAKHNVNVKLIYYDVYSDTYADLVGGKVDGLSVIVGDILPISTQKDVRFVFPVDASDGADELIVGQGIKTVADLKGKRIGVHFGTYSELFVRTLLKQNGIAIPDVTLVNIAADSAVQAFPEQVDAVHTYEPYASAVVKEGGHILLTSSDTPNLVLGTMAFPTRFVKDHPQDIQAFTDAWFEAVDWMYANPDQVPDVVAKAFSLKPEDVWFGGDKVFTRAEAKVLMQSANDSSSAYFITQSYIDFLETAGVLTQKLDPQNLIDPSFLK